MTIPIIDVYAQVTKEILRGDFEFETIENKAVLTWTPTFANITEEEPFYIAIEADSIESFTSELDICIDGVVSNYKTETEIEAYGVDFYFVDEDYNRIEKPSQWPLINANIKNALLNALINDYAQAS